MRRPYIPMLVFALLLLLLHLPFSLDFATSVVPGWHTSIVSPLMATTTVLTIILPVVIFIYWRLSKWAGRIPYTVFLPHFVLSLPMIIFTRFGELLIPHMQQYKGLATPEAQGQAIHSFILAASLLFLCGQLILIVYTIRILLKPDHRKKIKPEP